MLPFLALALVLHGILLAAVSPLVPWLIAHPNRPRSDVIELVEFSPVLSTDAKKTEDPPQKEEEKAADPAGQIVEIAPPEHPEIPEQSDYLAEYNQKVDEETRSERFKVNPDVLARRYSSDERAESRGDNVPDMQMTEPSTGATVGEQRFDPNRNGLIAAIPSPWAQTNQEGSEDPVPSSALESDLAGAPQNDLLDEKRGSETKLNTREFLYASYLLRVRRLVNFYWNQNLQNLPGSVRLVKSSYTTTVDAILDGNGSLDSLTVAEASGSRELDECVVHAFRVAGPYPNPPAGLVSNDGRVHLPEMGFTVTLGFAEMHYEAVDPRAGVQFPGILKAPR